MSLDDENQHYRDRKTLELLIPPSHVHRHLLDEIYQYDAFDIKHHDTYRPASFPALEALIKCCASDSSGNEILVANALTIGEIVERRLELIFVHHRAAQCRPACTAAVVSLMVRLESSLQEILGRRPRFEVTFFKHFTTYVRSDEQTYWFSRHLRGLLRLAVENGWPSTVETFEGLLNGDEDVRNQFLLDVEGPVPLVTNLIARYSGKVRHSSTWIDFVTSILQKMPTWGHIQSSASAKFVGVVISIWPEWTTSTFVRWLNLWRRFHCGSASSSARFYADPRSSWRFSFLVWRHYIAVDKAILSHCFTCAKSPLRRLAPIRDLQAVVYCYLYGPHSFPKRFFRDVYTPTKGHHLARKNAQ